LENQFKDSNYYAYQIIIYFLYPEKFFHRLHSQFKCLCHGSFAFYFVKLPLLKDYPPLSSYHLNK